MRIQAALEPARRHRRVHEVVQERQEPAEVGLLLDAGRKMPAGSLMRPREIFFCVFFKKRPILTLCDKMGKYIWDMGQILIQNFGPIVNRGASSKLRFLVVFKERRKIIPKQNNFIEILLKILYIILKWNKCVLVKGLKMK